MWFLLKRPEFKVPLWDSYQITFVAESNLFINKILQGNSFTWEEQSCQISLWKEKTEVNGFAPKYFTRNSRGVWGETIKTTHTWQCWLIINGTCLHLLKNEFCHKIDIYLIGKFYQHVYISLIAQSILNISPNLTSILRHNWKVASLEYHGESWGLRLCQK